MQQMDPPIPAVAPPLHQAAFLEVINEANHPARRQPELVGDRLLATTRLIADRSEHPNLGRRKAKWGDQLRKGCGRMGTELREQEARSEHDWTRSPGRGVRALGHEA
jgi:hypothetical protein